MWWGASTKQRQLSNDPSKLQHEASQTLFCVGRHQKRSNLQPGGKWSKVPACRMGIVFVCFLIHFCTRHFEFCAWHNLFMLTSSDNDCWLFQLYIFILMSSACELFPFLIKCISTDSNRLFKVKIKMCFYIWSNIYIHQLLFRYTYSAAC